MMSITVNTADGEQLLRTIKELIGEKKIVTWSYDDDGDFTHAVEQWRHKAWLRPSMSAEGITLGILAPKGITISTTVYAIYHGRFVEMLLTHCDKYFQSVVSTALPTSKDRIRSAA